MTLHPLFPDQIEFGSVFYGGRKTLGWYFCAVYDYVGKAYLGRAVGLQQIMSTTYFPEIVKL